VLVKFEKLGAKLQQTALEAAVDAISRGMILSRENGKTQ
jgi:hypothetical protein